jgi:type VI protein secretion system component Hcp
VTKVDPITIKRTSDASTAPLLVWRSSKKQRDKVLIDFCLPSGNFYLRYELAGVELVSCSLSYADPDRADETLVMTFDRVQIYQRPIDASGEVDIGAQSVVEYVVYQP